MIGPLETKLNKVIESRGAAFAVLLDPDATSKNDLLESVDNAQCAGADLFLVGGSFMANPAYAKSLQEIKKNTDLPVLLFPGAGAHVAPGADGLLFTSLVSGRNPQYLIEEQIKGSVAVMATGMEPLPTAYILIDGGKTTSVEFISNTRPIPVDKPQLSMVHALAASMMGMRWTYLEAGSGALNPVPASHVKMVAESVKTNLIVGGGIVEPQQAAERVQAGAQMIVTGNLWEKVKDTKKMSEFAAAIHTNN